MKRANAAYFSSEWKFRGQITNITTDDRYFTIFSSHRWRISFLNGANNSFMYFFLSSSKFAVSFLRASNYICIIIVVVVFVSQRLFVADFLIREYIVEDELDFQF